MELELDTHQVPIKARDSNIQVFLCDSILRHAERISEGTFRTGVEVGRYAVKYYLASDARSLHEASKYGMYEKEERTSRICEILETI
jgi:hypothetical protein